MVAQEVEKEMLDMLFKPAEIETNLSPDDLEFRFGIDKHYERVYLRPLDCLKRVVKQHDIYYYAHGQLEGTRFENFRAFDGEIVVRTDDGEGYYIKAIRVDNYTVIYKIVSEIVNLVYPNDNIKLNNCNNRDYETDCRRTSKLNSMRDLINTLKEEYTVENEYWDAETDETYKEEEELIIIEKIDSRDPFAYDYKITIDQAFKLIILISYSHICIIADLKEYAKAVKQILSKYVQ